MLENNIPILHIGYGKTASTWFQKEFFPKVTNIDFYCKKRIEKTVGINWKDNWTDLTINSFKNNERQILLSDESMIGNYDKIKDYVINYKKIFNEAQIIIFIRNQLLKLPSNYSQYIKSRGTKRFSNYLKQNGDYNILKKHCYDNVISLYKNYFGESNVYIYIYEEFNDNQQEFLKTFCANHKFNIEIEKINFVKQNIQLSKSLLIFRRLINILIKKNFVLVKFSTLIKRFLNLSNDFHFSTLFFEWFNNRFQNKTQLKIENLTTKDEIDFLKNYFSQSNRKLIEEHGLHKIKNYDYPL